MFPQLRKLRRCAFPRDCSYRQDANSGLGFIHGEQRAARQRLAMRPQRGDEKRAEVIRRHILRANLDHARAAILAVGEQDRADLVRRRDLLELKRRRGSLRN